MPTRKKIDWQKVQAALTTTRPNCGYEIRPAEIVRVSWEQNQCLKCGSRFEAAKAKGQTTKEPFLRFPSNLRNGPMFYRAAGFCD